MDHQMFCFLDPVLGPLQPNAFQCLAHWVAFPMIHYRSILAQLLRGLAGPQLGLGGHWRDNPSIHNLSIVNNKVMEVICLTHKGKSFICVFHCALMQHIEGEINKSKMYSKTKDTEKEHSQSKQNKCSGVYAGERFNVPWTWCTLHTVSEVLYNRSMSTPNHCAAHIVPILRQISSIAHICATLYDGSERLWDNWMRKGV
mmetsp:Transcript_128797/g.222540  ORF Transcript_128797/g.222540 Transcript_128797/m.222540 type:complete len:200 (-) Transcript_128797:255-854(-)